MIEGDFEECEGLTIDWIARNIYWTDRALHKIEVAKLDGSARRVLISLNVRYPRGISVDPIRG